jgi:hypothetical protein
MDVTEKKWDGVAPKLFQQELELSALNVHS